MSNSSINEDWNTAASRKVTGVLVAVILVVSALSFKGIGSYYNAYAQDNRNGINNNNNNLGVQITEPTPELTAQWWQWLLSFPVDENPATDTTGEDCSKGDFGDTFFLAGTLGGKAERECTITEGQDILIPIVTTICATITGETAESLLAQCADFTEQTRNLKLIIDRNQVRNLEDNRVTVESLFTISDLPENNLFGLPAGSSIDAVADGYWVLIENLSAGEHDITVVGKQHGHLSSGEKWDLKTDVTYHLSVEGE
jgi:hypothetical protein